MFLNANMQRVLRFTTAIVLLGLSISFAYAQTAPDIARGMSGDAVIRAYGWPKGKSAAENREIWMYDGFQVIFDSGRVVSVSPIAPSKSMPQRPRVPTASAPTLVRPTLPRAAPKTTIRIPLPRPIQSKTEEPPFRGVVAQQPAEPLPVADTPSLLNRLWPWVVLACLIAIGAVVAAERKRLADEIREREMRVGVPPPPVPKTWQEIIAEKLAGMSVSSVEPASPIVTPPSLLTELSPWLLERIEWKRFELLSALYFGATGVRTEAAELGPDGGIDVKLYRAGELQPYAFVQCKAWEKDVGVALIRELFGVMSAARVAEGVFVTTGDFTEEAREFAGRNHITAITGRDLINRFNRLEPVERWRILAQVTEGDYTTPTCPSCGLKLVLREGSNAFWGCRNYPRCSVKIYPRKSHRG